MLCRIYVTIYIYTHISAVVLLHKQPEGGLLEQNIVMN